jgi:hypothetical protein
MVCLRVTLVNILPSFVGPLEIPTEETRTENIGSANTQVVSHVLDVGRRSFWLRSVDSLLQISG